MNENRLFIFTYDKGGRLVYRGYYNGQTFIPKAGFCESFEELKEYDFVEIYGMDGMLIHTPKRYNKKLEKTLDLKFIEYYGEQISLF